MKIIIKIKAGKQTNREKETDTCIKSNINMNRPEDLEKEEKGRTKKLKEK